MAPDLSRPKFEREDVGHDTNDLRNGIRILRNTTDIVIYDLSLRSLSGGVHTMGRNVKTTSSVLGFCNSDRSLTREGVLVSARRGHFR